MHAIPGIDDDALRRLVGLFYERVRADAALGPVFEDAIHDWPAHLGTLADFWSSVMLTSGRYKGNPMAAHLKHRARITPALFERWLELWAQTTAELLPPACAAGMQAKAARIARSLQIALSPLPLRGAA
jgi:hemoglobin